MIEVREATLDDALAVAEHIRPEDAEEIAALTSAAPKTALRASLESSRLAKAVLVDGEVVAVFGVADIAASKEIGTVWLMGTPGLEAIPWEFAKQSQRYLDEMFDARTYRVVRNYVYLKNETHVRWLKWLGAKFLGPKIRGFQRFEIYR